MARWHPTGVVGCFPPWFNDEMPCGRWPRSVGAGCCCSAWWTTTSTWWVGARRVIGGGCWPGSRAGWAGCLAAPRSSLRGGVRSRGARICCRSSATWRPNRAARRRRALGRLLCARPARGPLAGRVRRRAAPRGAAPVASGGPVARAGGRAGGGDARLGRGPGTEGASRGSGGDDGGRPDAGRAAGTGVGGSCRVRCARPRLGHPESAPGSGAGDHGPVGATARGRGRPTGDASHPPTSRAGAGGLTGGRRTGEGARAT